MKSDDAALEQAYTGGTNYGKLWSPTRDGTKVEINIPRLLILPPVFVKLIRDTGKALMPHEVWSLVKAYRDTPGLPQECKDACTFVRDWCLVAAQATGPDKDSYLAFGLNAVTEQDHGVSLASWLDTRIDTMLGRRPKQKGPTGSVGMVLPYPQGPTVDAKVITWAVGQGLALGYQHLLPQCGAPTAAIGGGQVGKAGDMAYSADDVCAVMTYSGIKDPEDCQAIWTIFSEKKKNIEACR